MRIGSKHLTLVVCIAALSAGCASAERKLGRGLTNLSEPLRMGELQRSFEQTYLWDGPDAAQGRGIIAGMNRTVGRTAVGLFEVLTFPVPSEPYFKPENPVYPDTYKPGILDTSAVRTDTSLGFDSTDVAPMFPGSRFKIFE
jgi:putative exosortase-associated protein (TIGR04073 family)